MKGSNTSLSVHNLFNLSKILCAILGLCVQKRTSIILYFAKTSVIGLTICITNAEILTTFQ